MAPRLFLDLDSGRLLVLGQRVLCLLARRFCAQADTVRSATTLQIASWTQFRFEATRTKAVAKAMHSRYKVKATSPVGARKRTTALVRVKHRLASNETNPPEVIHSEISCVYGLNPSPRTKLPLMARAAAAKATTSTAACTVRGQCHHACSTTATPRGWRWPS